MFQSTLKTITWGYLPNKNAKPVLTVPSESTVTFDTVSHEGLLEDQGRDAEKVFFIAWGWNLKMF